ncbi:hypothetical protein CBR_g46777 [Chara braunii]|uniref:Clathrin heavy chain linker core motif domain-containing protein n=1 Tax=Chara braunii TaxID=69332 RepID=A0A388M151_CHABU|nr:hypothetical protein CBR_g46777 [Chara braunii]|eukprot:GBG88209.1 hypothetical protein CBR_g46777 [Chara braunii]
MVDTRSGKSTSRCTQAQQEQMTAPVKEKKERKELLKQAKVKAIAEEQATKMKKLEEEMEEKKKVAEEEAAAAAEEERKLREAKGESSGTKNEDAQMEKKIGKANFRKQADLFFPPDFADDFPVAMQVSQKYALVYVITKLGLLFVYDLETATAVYRNRISPEQIFLTTDSPTTGGFYAVNRRGQVLIANVNENTIVPFVSNQLGNLELAVNLAKRGNLPGAENLVVQRFQELFAQMKYKEAAELAAESPQGILRKPETILRFQSVPAIPGQTSPLLQYFGALLSKGSLNAVEAIELSKLVLAQNKRNLLENWLNEDKLECSEELGDLVKPVDAEMALKVFIKARAAAKVVATLAERREFDRILKFRMSSPARWHGNRRVSVIQDVVGVHVAIHGWGQHRSPFPCCLSERCKFGGVKTGEQGRPVEVAGDGIEGFLETEVSCGLGIVVLDQGLSTETTCVGDAKSASAFGIDVEKVVVKRVVGEWVKIAELVVDGGEIWAREVALAGLAWSDIFLGEDEGDDGVVSADGEVLPVEVRAPDCEGVNHGEGFLLVGGVIHLCGKEPRGEWYGSNGEVRDVSGDIEMASGVGDLEDRGGGDGLLEHYEELIVPESRAECGFMGVLLADLDLVEAIAKFNLNEISGSTKSIKELGDPRSREVNSFEEVEVVSLEAMLWKKRGRGGADVNGVGVEVEAEACSEEGVGWGVEEGGVVVVTTVMSGEFPSSVVTRSEMAAMVVLMVAREDLRAVDVWRIVASYLRVGKMEIPLLVVTNNLSENILESPVRDLGLTISLRMVRRGEAEPSAVHLVEPSPELAGKARVTVRYDAQR